jgi:hypothetical protein
MEDHMNDQRRRLLAISGATFALIVAGTAAVSAHPGEDEWGMGPGFGRDHMGGRFQQGDVPGLGRGGWMGRGGMGLGLDDVDAFVRRETTLDLGEDGIVTQRVDHGTVASVAEAGLTYALATGEEASITTDADTQVIALSEPATDDMRPFGRGMRMTVEEVALADVAAGSEVVVWAQSQEDGTFLAQRIVIHAAADEAAATDAAEGTSDSSTDTSTDA